MSIFPSMCWATWFTLNLLSSTRVVNESTLLFIAESYLSTNAFIYEMILSWFWSLPQASFHTKASRSSILLSSQFIHAGISSMSVVIFLSKAPFISIMLASMALTFVISSTFSGLLKFKLAWLIDSGSLGGLAPRIGGRVMFFTVSDRTTPGGSWTKSYRSSSP